MRLSPLLLAAVVTPAFADNAPAATPPAATIYRFEVSITGIEQDPKAAPATYTLTLQENTTGLVSTGANIAMTSGQNATRQNVGLDIKMSYTLRNGVVVLSGDLEMSAVEATQTNGAPNIHRVRAENVIPITGTSPTLFTSVYDVVSHRRYEVNVSAKKLL